MPPSNHTLSAKVEGITHSLNVRSQVAPDHMIQTMTTLTDLARSGETWDCLAAGRNAVHSFVYSQAWAAGLEPDQQLRVLMTGKNGSPAIAPLVINRGGHGELNFLAAEMYEILDFLYAVPDALPSLCGAIVRTGRPIYLKRLPADSLAVTALRDAYRHKGVVIVRPVEGALWIPLDASWIEPEAHLNSGRKSDLRRAWRLAERLGQVDVQITLPDRESLAHLVEEFFRVEAAGWKGANGTALTLDPTRNRFFRRLAIGAQQAGILRFGFLRIDGRAAAAQIAIESGGTFSLLRAGYDEQFGRCSPGVLLLAETIRYAARRGLRSYEFNGSVEPWAKIWTNHEHPCCSLRAYPFTLRGMATVLADAGSRVLHKIRRPRRTQP